MRRRTVFRVVGVVLVIAAGAYSAFWWIAAGKIEDAVTAGRESAQAQKIDASWKAMHVSGYPLSFRLELGDVVVKDGATTPPTELHAPMLTASVRPWDLHAATFAAPDGIEVAAGSEAAPVARVSAERGGGAVLRGDAGRLTVWLSLYQAKATAGLTLSARSVHAWLILPPQAPETHQEAGLTLAINAREVTPPVMPPGFNGPIDDVGFGLTLMGTFPPGPLRQAAGAWRDSGGTLELDHLQLRWGDLRINGSGTLALDNDLQPIGGFSGGVSGFDQLLSALVASGRIKASDARVARLALAMLAKAGPDGRPEISSSFAIQNGEMYLGPAKLGPAPRIDW
ncbi:MAG TPA: DUF2125 domain-containing protein [Stellaceae bacterium]|nr:DUF2125 domain-containing protein [Stellaceae bacterium]